MKNSSAASDRYSGVTDFAADSGSSTVREASAALESTATTSIRFRLPEFGNYAQASTARRAGRLNAGAISEADFKKLLDERQSLLDRKFDGTMTRKDVLRLQYVEWNLDRVEDARNGQHLDSLEEVVMRYEYFMQDMKNLISELKRASGASDE